jgi:ACS family hexuronate transporter-like MFS transporter
MRERGWSRWLPTVAMMLVSLISYIDRNTLALLAPTILKETQLTAREYGWIISAFSVAYMIGNPLWGRLLDRIGVRIGMLVAVSLWTLASASHALAAGLVGFAAARALLGFGEGATFPGGLRTAAQTLAPHQRARGVALAYSGGSLGAIITPLVVTPVAVAFGWRAAFVCTGLVGAAWLVLFAFVGRHPALRAPREAPGEGGPSFRDPRVWAFIAAYALGALPLALVLYGAPIYLTRALGYSQIDLGKVLWLPPLGWEIGYFVWGAITDRLLRSGTPPVPAFTRCLGWLALASVPLAATPWLPAHALVLAELVAAMFVASGFVIVPLAYATHVYSTRHSAYLAGLGAGSWSAGVALVMPLFGALFDRGGYGRAFAITAAAPLVAFAIFRALTLAAERREALAEG